MLVLLFPFTMKNMKTKTEHYCKFTKTCETLDQLYPPYSKYSKIKRRFRELFLISEENGRRCFTPQGKTGYITAKEKQLKEYFYMIHPYSKFREIWELTAVIEICLGFSIRLFAACDCTNKIWTSLLYQIFILFADVFETIDVFLLFIVGFVDKESGNVVFEFRKIFFHRILDLYFFINVAVSLPLEFLSFLYAYYKSGSTQINILRNFVFLKILKMPVCTKYFTHLAKIYNLPELFTVFLWGILCNIFVCHWLTCTYHQILIYITDPPATHSSRSANHTLLEHSNFFLHYSKILYTISGVLLNKNIVLRKISSYKLEDNFFWYFTITALYFCSLITFGLEMQYMVMRNSKVYYEEMKQAIQKFLVQENLPKHIHKKVMKYLQFRYRNTYFAEELIMKALSPPLRREVASFLCLDLVIHAKSIFVDIPIDLATELCLLMTYEVFLPGDVIFRAGDKPMKMFFLYSGSVAVYSEKGKEVMHWYEGQQFGVTSFIPDVSHPVTVLALEMSECYILRYKDFLKTTYENPEYVKIVSKAARERRQYVVGLYSEG